MPNDLPLKFQVSVIMITYNRGHLIEESIRSVMIQTYENWELIIVDDGSEDDTEEVIQRLKDPKIRYYKVNHCGRLGKLRNFGIKMAVGEYIAFQDSDDLWLPKKLELQIDLLKKFPEAAFVLSSSSQFGENAIQVPDYESSYVGNLFLPILKEKRFHFCGTSLLFKKSVTYKVGFLDEEIRMMRELHFFLRMSAIYDGIFTNERLVKVRRHANNTSNFYHVEAHKTSIEMFREFLKKGFLSRKQFKEVTSDCFYKIGIAQLKHRQPLTAAKAFFQSTILNPFNWRNLIRFFLDLLFSSKNLLKKTTAAPGRK
jgi:glycosyltransferase involved in cell wall biosynthesis